MVNIAGVGVTTVSTYCLFRWPGKLYKFYLAKTSHTYHTHEHLLAFVNKPYVRFLLGNKICWPGKLPHWHYNIMISIADLRFQSQFMKNLGHKSFNSCYKQNTCTFLYIINFLNNKNLTIIEGAVIKCIKKQQR